MGLGMGHDREGFIRKTAKFLIFFSIGGGKFSHFHGEKPGNKLANNFFAKKACLYHIWG
jgi:hypothetical protein